MSKLSETDRFKVPNLDCLEEKELDELADIFQHLHDYARIKSSAISYRLAGDIQVAMDLEGGCERIYRKLPEWARW